MNRKPLSVVTAILVLCTIILPLFGNSASEAYVPELQNRIKSVEQKNTPVDLKKWFFNPYYHWVLRYYYDEIASDITVFRNSDMDDISYTYDANGNLKQRITTAGIEKIIYNPRNQPIAIVKGGEKVVSFTYDSIGMRNRSLDLETGKQQDYLREGRKVLAEMDGKGANRKVYRYGNGPMGYVANGLPQFTSRDPLGSPFAVSSATGRFLETRQYEPFGESTALMDSVDDYPNVHIHFQHSTLADSAIIGDVSTTDQDPKTGTVIADLPLAGAVGETYEPELFLTIGDDPENTHLPVHQVPLIMVTDLPPPYMTLEADTLVFEPTTTDPVTYTLTIEPVGNTFNDVIVTIPLPTTVEYNETISEKKPIHDTLTNTLTWDYPQLIGTQTIVFTITVDFIKNYNTWLDLQATLTATELFSTNRLSNTASTAIFNNGLVALITPKADFDPTFTNKPTAYALLDPDPLATSQSITCDYKIKLLGETSQNTQTFVGKETDPHTDLIYFGARFYDPVIGRFISEDPYIGNIWEPRSLAQYAYGFNNPLIFVDPFGYATLWGSYTGGKYDRFETVNYESGYKILDYTLFLAANTVANTIHFAGNALMNINYIGDIPEYHDKLVEFLDDEGYVDQYEIYMMEDFLILYFPPGRAVKAKSGLSFFKQLGFQAKSGLISIKTSPRLKKYLDTTKNVIRITREQLCSEAGHGNILEDFAEKIVKVIKPGKEQKLLTIFTGEKLAAYQRYLNRGGKWSSERWSNVYEALERNRRKGKIYEQIYEALLNGGKQTFNTDYGKRIVDVFDGRIIHEIKSGYVYKSKAIRWQIIKDKAIQRIFGYKIVWHLPNGASKNLIDHLTMMGVEIKV